MSTITDPLPQHSVQTAPLSTLIERCQANQTHGLLDESFGGDDGACFELLRRALEGEDDAAWRAFEKQFLPLFYHWLQQDLVHFGLPTADPAELEELWAEARSRFVTRYARLQTLSDTFSHIGAVLKVIHKCLRSTVQESRRRQERQQRLVTAIEQLHRQQNGDRQLPASQVELEELRRCITDQLEQDLPEPELRQLIVLRYVDELKPREISARLPDEYPDAATVHKALERIIKRLRRRIEQYVTRCL
ncbi:MAG: hypothetical protein R2932_44040 [Caldilineaceae bacterium]